MSDGLRLNRFLALAGLGSRRAADEWIAAGRVTVNGAVCQSPGTTIGPTDHVKLDGRRVAAREFVTIVLHKPRGFVCSRADELGRPTIYSLLPRSLHHLAHVGRLDRDSEGLLILTNDGSLARRLTHPSAGVEKEYLVTLDHAIDDAALRRMTRGIRTSLGQLVAVAVRRVSARRVRVTLDHGVKRQIRVMFEALGWKVDRLLRIRIGGLHEPHLPPGSWRRLGAADRAKLGKNPQNLRKISHPDHRRDL